MGLVKKLRHLLHPLRREYDRQKALRRPTEELLRYRWLRKYIDIPVGFFVEAGAHNGILRSNTLHFQKEGWSGLLVEPVPALAEQARANRAGAIVEQCALVSPEYTEDTVSLTYADSMTLVKGAMKDEAADRAHIEAALPHMVSDEKPFEFLAPARTLTAVLLKHGVKHVDFFSLDVEGFELQVLKGIDFELFQPTWLLVEARFRSEVDEFLLPRYRVVAETGDYDVLYQWRATS